jgi:hypothetical protein
MSKWIDCLFENTRVIKVQVSRLGVIAEAASTLGSQELANKLIAISQRIEDCIINIHEGHADKQHEEVSAIEKAHATILMTALSHIPDPEQKP